MALNTIPIHIETQLLGKAQVSTANANRDGTGTLGTVATGGSNGTLIQLVRYQAAVTTTAGMIRLFIDDGSNTRLLHEMPVSAVTASGTVAAAMEGTGMPRIEKSAFAIPATRRNAKKTATRIRSERLRRATRLRFFNSISWCSRHDPYQWRTGCASARKPVMRFVQVTAFRVLASFNWRTRNDIPDRVPKTLLGG